MASGRSRKAGSCRPGPRIRQGHGGIFGGMFSGDVLNPHILMPRLAGDVASYRGPLTRNGVWRPV